MNQESKEFDAWVSKFALTIGLQKVKATRDPSFPMMIRFSDGKRTHYIGGKSWHVTKEVAVAKAEKMRAKRISALKSQIALLESIDFRGTN